MTVFTQFISPTCRLPLETQRCPSTSQAAFCAHLDFTELKR
jgi:hypothetical protein